MTDERTVTVEFTEFEASMVAGILMFSSGSLLPASSTAYSKVRGALNALGPEPEEKPVPEKPKRGRPRKATTTE